MTTVKKTDLGRRDFLKAPTIASTPAAFGAFAIVGNLAVAQTNAATAEARLIQASLTNAELRLCPASSKR